METRESKMDSDFPENDAEIGKQPKPKVDSPDLAATPPQHPDAMNDTVDGDDTGDAENSQIESQFDVSDSGVGVDFDVLESAGEEGPSLDGPLLEPFSTSSPVNSVEAPVDPVATFPADLPKSESTAASPLEMERHGHSGLQPSPPEMVSPHGIEHATEHRPIEEWTFAIDSSMSSNLAAETPATFAPDAIVGTTPQSSTSTPGDISRAETGSRFSESADTVSSSAAQAAGDSVPPSHSKLNVEPAALFVDAKDDAISDLLRHNWDRGIPLPEDQSPDPATSFRMPPLLLEVSRTDYQSRIEKIEEAAAARLNRIIDERIEDAISEREFMRAAEIRALFR
jgi:hypothetical protein